MRGDTYVKVVLLVCSLNFGPNVPVLGEIMQSR